VHRVIVGFFEHAGGNGVLFIVAENARGGVGGGGRVEGGGGRKRGKAGKPDEGKERVGDTVGNCRRINLPGVRNEGGWLSYSFYRGTLTTRPSQENKGEKKEVGKGSNKKLHFSSNRW